MKTFFDELFIWTLWLVFVSWRSEKEYYHADGTPMTYDEWVESKNKT